ncbi:MAG: AAA family ATPase [Desulfobacteraceae bacterium]|nr:AAA family ATPase [Desulfobacteraceae bacterium]
MEMQYWFAEQEARLRNLPTTKRCLYAKIDWSARCLGILGARGTGKTTIMLQRLLESESGGEKALYVSVDHPRFQTFSLYDFGRNFHAYGGRVLVLDEVHKYPNWAGHIKTLYDSCPELQIIFSGSSVLQMQEQDADLSRRAVMYCLHGLSFREFLLFELGESFPALTLENVLQDHASHTREINNRVQPLEHFRNYLHYGYYPFFLEGKDVYSIKLGNVINHVLETDLPQARRIDLRQIVKLKKLLSFLALSAPSQVNIQKLSASTEISRPKVYEYLESLHQARLLNLIRGAKGGYKIISKPDKIYLENPNLACALTEEQIHTGTLRETFFVTQIRNAYALWPAEARHILRSAYNGDFLVKEAFTFEIGGKNKTAAQIKGVDNAFIAADEIETGFKAKIPLWLFGFLY